MEASNGPVIARDIRWTWRSRGDPGRVFGEALTYVERSKRGLNVRLASGDDIVVPDNLFILATMNPLDRGVDEVDAAFERRFAKIAMEPSRDILEEMLVRNGMEEGLRRQVVRFFDRVNGQARTNPQAAIGHTFFADAHDETTLHRVWNHQLRFIIEKAFRLDPDTREDLNGAWARIFSSRSPRPSTEAQAEESLLFAEGRNEPVTVIDGGRPGDGYGTTRPTEAAPVISTEVATEAAERRDES